ncbi:MAG TPA: hypothetical protein DDW52_05830, partial [Planctomycetaceae bacterium]|nr:hypothetical protein [Planctomycetaceae bacterium]
MDLIGLDHLLLPAWLLCGLLVWIGLVALWIYNRKWPWFISVFAAIVASSPALLAEAFEIFWLCVISILTAMVLLALSTRFLFAEPRTSREWRRISVFELLAITGFVGIGVAVGANTPELTPAAWIGLVSICVLAVTLPVCVYFHQQSDIRLRFRTPIAVVLATVSAIPAVAWDELFVSLVWETEWPIYRGPFAFVVTEEWANALWFAIAACAGPILLLGWAQLRSRSPIKYLGRVLLVAALSTLGIAIVFLCYPHAQLHVRDGPNALEDALPTFRTLADSDLETQFATYDEIDQVPNRILDDCLQQIEPELDSLVARADQPMFAVLGDGSEDDIFRFEFGHVRFAVRALVARAGRRLELGNIAGATSDYQTVYKLA